MARQVPDDRLYHAHPPGVGPRDAPALVVLHGMYGSGRNWASVMRSVAERRPDWDVLLVDLREHGHSPSRPPPHDLHACAEDVGELLDALAVERAVLFGHSFGGKVALTLTWKWPRRIREAWVADADPGARPPSGEAWRMLRILQDLPEAFPSREEAIRAMQTRGLPRGVGEWMATNLRRTADGFRWRFDRGTIERLLRETLATDLWEVVEAPPAETAIHVLKAKRSPMLSEDACGRIDAAARRTGRVHLHGLSGDHWLNVTSPKEVIDLVVEQLPPGRVKG